MRWMLVAATWLAVSGAQQTDSLLVAARRAAAHWMHHDFGSLLGGEAVMVYLPGTEPSSALRPAQAAELLRAFAESAQELEVTVLVARNVDPDRGYVEAQRVYQVYGSDVRRSQTLYFGFRRAGPSYRLIEVRALP